MTITSDSFKMHIESKDNQSKADRAKFLYGNYTFDCALPQNWITNTIEKTGQMYEDIVNGFVWGYIGKDYEGPLPLNLKACDILKQLEDYDF